MLKIGDVIDDKYEILSVIGKGGMSTVYLSINRSANRKWAVKEVLKNGTSSDDVVKQNLIAEIDMLKKLSHKNLPRIIDVIDKDDCFLIVMDYIEGQSLKTLLDEYGAQPQDKVVEWAMQLADVLQYLHSQHPPIIYRDMKPGNVMLKPDGNIMLIDFGTAREYKHKNNEDTTCLGTPGYAAPEQYKGENHHQTDVRTDIYNLGATMYHLVTNHHPNEPPYVMRPITGWNGALSKNLERIILKCTQPSPSDRYKSCAMLMYDLQNYREKEAVANKQRIKEFVKFISMPILACVCLAGGKLCLDASEKYDIKDYQEQLSIAGISDNYNEKLLAYLAAISICPQNIEPYNSMLDLFINRNQSNSSKVITDYETDVINSLYGNGLDTIIDEICSENGLEFNGDNVKNKNFMEYLKENPENYGQFCYDVGTAYWNYSSDITDKNSNALKWFSEAYEYLPNSNENKNYAYICQQIGKYSQIIEDSPDDGIYSEYFSTLSEIIYSDEISPSVSDKTILLNLYTETIDFIYDSKSQLKIDGIARDDIISLLEFVENRLSDMQSNNQQIAYNIEKCKSDCHNLIYNIKIYYNDN